MMMKNMNTSRGLIIVLCLTVLFTNLNISTLGSVTTSTTITVEADTYIDESTSNYGGNDFIMVSKTQYSRDVGLIRFSLTAIPNGSTINSASLQLYAFYVSETNEIGVHECPSNWEEFTVSSATRPRWEDSAFETILVTSDEKWYSWKITDMVNKSLSSDQISFAIVAETQIQGLSLGVWFLSKENNLNKDPKMVVDYSKTASGAPGFQSYVLLSLLLLPLLKNRQSK